MEVDPSGSIKLHYGSRQSFFLYSLVTFHRADFLNWMPSTETQDAGDAEEIQESAESAFATALQGIPS